VSLALAEKLNTLWHSRLPEYRQSACHVAYVAESGNLYYACAIWAQPSSAMVDQTWIELKRMAIADDAPKNTASRMLSWMVRDIRRRYPTAPKLISYQDPAVHAGTIYKAAGWTCTGQRKSGGFASAKVRFRPPDQAPGDKIRWELTLRESPNESSSPTAGGGSGGAQPKGTNEK
jgi:hypothetical protein